MELYITVELYNHVNNIPFPIPLLFAVSLVTSDKEKEYKNLLILSHGKEVSI